ncbi:PEBP-like protein [Meredithblackwellia eburnea MCA 4105]
MPDISLASLPEHLKKNELYGAPWTPEGWVPKVELSVSYPSGAKVEQGNVLTCADSAPDPILEFESEPGATYAIVMADPDAPHRSWPFLGIVRHYLQGGITGVAGSTKVQINNPVTTPHRGPGPPPFTGLHRYVYLLYKEPAGGLLEKQTTFSDPASITQRMRWDLGAFVKENNLELIAINFFQARF